MWLAIFMNLISAISAVHSGADVEDSISPDCNYASDLVFKAHQLSRKSQGKAQQKLLFKRAIFLCPDRPEMYVSLADILAEEKNYDNAVYYYQQATVLRTQFSKAWYGLGEVYYHQKKYLMSLEAHLHICEEEKRAKTRVQQILKNKLWHYTPKQVLIDYENLLFIFDTEKRNALNQSLDNCGFEKTLQIRPIHRFFNLTFKQNKFELVWSAYSQLNEIAQALLNLPLDHTIHIHAHADNEPFFHADKKKNKQLNQALSEKRALAVANEIEEKGIPLSRIKVYGHSNKQIIESGKSETASEKNRRIEIEVISPSKKQTNKLE